MDLHLADPLVMQDPSIAARIHHNLRLREQQLAYYGRSQHLDKRSGIVDWIHNIVRAHNLATITAFTAVSYFDRFSDQAFIPVTSLELAALACVLIAAKCEEREEDIPRFRRLLQLPSQQFTAAELEAMEMIILQASDWNMVTVVPANYTEYYCHHSITLADTVCDLPVIDPAGLEETLRDYAEFFLESSSREYAMNQFAPSVLAAGAVAATRICLRVEPRWSESLERASCLMEADVVPCVIEMLRIYEEANATQRHESPISAHQAAQEMLMVGAQQQQQHADLLKPLSRSANVSPVPWMLHTEAAAEEMDDDFRRVTNC